MSSGNAITVRLQTARDRTTHGELKLVLTSVRNDFFHRADCSGQFKCKTSGDCLDKNLVCDGKAVCQDKSDESNCKMHNLTCFDIFTCINGQCIDKNGVCDGRDQCYDGSDEIDCHGITTNLMLILLGLVGLVCVIMLWILIVVCIRFYSARNSAYKQLT
ncbi:suppressor of tumorigenicity 14 protein-like [Dreissena polymorpha]|nr:suppressor of tumorigenicity 14 protein-like [Dreissena polymorpha]